MILSNLNVSFQVVIFQKLIVMKFQVKCGGKEILFFKIMSASNFWKQWKHHKNQLLMLNV